VRRRTFHVHLFAFGLGFASALLVAPPVAGDDPGAPIKLSWIEGDLAGITSILSPDSAKPIGYIEYHQRRRGGVVEATRIARFNDGSSDEDTAIARVGKRLRSLRGRSVIRNTQGIATVDIAIDVEAGRLSGFSGLGKDREAYDVRAELPEGTYWGPLIFMVIKNFDANAVGNRLVFRTVVVTPKPRVIDSGADIGAVHFVLRPTVNWLVDPIVRMLASDTDFFVRPGAPPILVRFAGPRNFAEQKIRIE
jgi:hypothetical protein